LRHRLKPVYVNRSHEMSCFAFVINLCRYSHPPGWSGDGCTVVKTTDDHVECSCNHLTHFGILMEVTELEVGCLMMLVNVIMIMVIVQSPNWETKLEVQIGGPNQGSKSEVQIRGPNQRFNQRSKSEVQIGGSTTVYFPTTMDKNSGDSCQIRTTLLFLINFFSILNFGSSLFSHFRFALINSKPSRCNTCTTMYWVRRGGGPPLQPPYVVAVRGYSRAFRLACMSRKPFAKEVN